MTFISCDPFFIARFLQAGEVDVVTSGHILTLGPSNLEEVLKNLNQLKVHWQE